MHTRAAEDRLRFALGTRVRIVRKGKGGRIEIDFTSEDELQRLFEYLTGPIASSGDGRRRHTMKRLTDYAACAG